MKYLLIWTGIVAILVAFIKGATKPTQRNV